MTGKARGVSGEGQVMGTKQCPSVRPIQRVRAHQIHETVQPVLPLCEAGFNFHFCPRFCGL